MYSIRLLLFAIRASFCCNCEEAAKKWENNKKYFVLTPKLCSFTGEAPLTCSGIFSWKERSLLLCLKLSTASVYSNQWIVSPDNQLNCQTEIFGKYKHKQSWSDLTSFNTFCYLQNWKKKFAGPSLVTRSEL